jgi:hypothetical protein
MAAVALPLEISELEWMIYRNKPVFKLNLTYIFSVNALH